MCVCACMCMHVCVGLCVCVPRGVGEHELCESARGCSGGRRGVSTCRRGRVHLHRQKGACLLVEAGGGVSTSTGRRGECLLVEAEGGRVDPHSQEFKANMNVTPLPV